MFKSWRLGKLFGFPIEINLTFLILLGVVAVAFGGSAPLQAVLGVVVAFGFVVLHELGHALVARRLGVRVTGIELGFLGGAAKMANLPRTPRHELMIAAAGPAVSLMLGGALVGLGFALGRTPLAWYVLGGGLINLVIAAFNLIPALPMDGGRILRALLARRFDYVRATDHAVTVARVVTVGFVVVGLFAQMYQLLILAPFLWMMGSRERMIARMASDEGWYSGDEIEVLDRDAWRERGRYHDDDDGGGWGSPFDRRTRRGGEMWRFTRVRRNGRL
jgi:Zn-dependent protease